MGVTPTEKASWELLDQLRGEPHQLQAFVEPLAAMLFLRWADFQEAEAEAMAAFDESDYSPLLQPSLHWRCWHDFPPDELSNFFSYRLPEEIERLNGAPHDPIAGSLRRILPAIRSVGQFSPQALTLLIGWLAAQPFETPNDRRLLLEAFDAFLDHATGREAGQFRTPTDIANLLVALAAPAPGERVYDPCFGFAGILTAACSYMDSPEKSGFTRKGSPALEIAGVEINSTAFTVGLARLALAGVTHPQLEHGNSLERESVTNPQKEGFDLVISNPPWGGRVEPRGLDHFPIPSNDSTDLFVQHALSQLRPDGRAVMVVPQSFLFRSGKTARIREWLLERHRVDALVGLPDGAFLPYAAIKAAILVIHRKGGPTNRLRMVDGSTFFEPRKGRDSARILPKHIEAIVGATTQTTPPKDAWDVDVETLAELDFNLIPERRESSELEGILNGLGEDIPVLALKDLCEISGGIHVKSSNLLEQSAGEQPVPYLRIGDIKQGQAGKATSWVAEEAAAGLAPRHKLRAGEVVFSRSGTIGKVGVIRNGAVGGVASNGLFVLSPDTSRIDPHFLAAYLASSECHDWLQSKAGGSVIRNLKKQFVEGMPVPVPPLPVQHRVAKDVREHDVDALTQLSLLLSQDEDDPTARWLDRSLKHLRDSAAEEDIDPSRSVRMRVFGPEFREARNRVVHNSERSALSAWVIKLESTSEVFRDSEDVPRGPALLSMLQHGMSDLNSAASTLEGHSPLEARARELTKECVVRLDKAIESLMSDVRILIQPNTDTLLAGTKVEFSLVVRNEGALPLRNLVIEAKEWDFHTKPTFIPELATKTLTVEVDTPSNTGRHLLVIEWHAAGLDGRKHHGNQEIAFELESEHMSNENVDLGPSPYFHGPPVGPDRDDVFFGRQELLERIKRQIVGGNTVLLEGNRRAGKSSILKHLEGADRIPGWFAVFSDFQGATGDKEKTGMPTEAVWRTLAQSLASGLVSLGIDIPLPNGATLPAGSTLGVARACREGISADAPWEDFQDYLKQVLHLLEGKDYGLVLMIDEFDKLQEGIDNGVTSPQIPENIRYLIQTQPRFVAVMTGSRRMQRLRHEYWSALYGLGNRIGVTALDRESAQRLITDPVEGRLLYSDEALEAVINLTARQPFLIQYLCNRIFELASYAARRSVNLPLVREAAQAFVKDNEHFASLWDYAETDRRRFLLALCHKEAGSSDPLTFGVLQERLGAEGIEVSDTDLDSDLKFLQELELIDYAGTDGGEAYRLTIPLMGQWLDTQQDFHALRAKSLTVQEEQIAPKPYSYGSPIGPDRDDIFYGRQELLEKVKQQIQSRKCVILEGARRSGKTSLLNHLEGPDRIPGWLSVLVNFMVIDGDGMSGAIPSEAVCRTLAQRIASGLTSLRIAVPLPDGTILEASGNTHRIAKACREGISADDPWEDFQDYLKQVLQLLDSRGLGLVLMLDEFERLLEGIDAGVTQPEILERILSLLESQPQLLVVMAGSKRLNRMQGQSWAALRNLSSLIEINPLDDDSARLLVTEPVKGRLQYSDEALESVLHLTAGQPFLIQLLCSRIIDHADMLRSRSVDANLVGEVALAFVNDSEYFAGLWSRAETYRRRLVLALCHKESGGSDPITFDFLQERLRAENLEISDSELKADLEYLQELDLIDHTEGSDGHPNYCLTIPLMGQWLDTQQDYQALLAEALTVQEKHQ